jgi:ribonuclease R
MKKNFLEGMIKRHPDGFGFFIPDDRDHPDVYVPRQSMESVMTGDRVMIEVFPERGGQRFRGEIMKVISRGTKTIVGTFHQLNSTTGIIRDDGKGWGEDLKIAIKDSMNAKNNELVSAEILSYPGDRQGFHGKVLSVIGDALDPLTDVRRVLLQNNIPHEFPENVLAEASRFSEHVSESDMKNRKDLRKLSFITIDGATAKDFDDAIYVESKKDGFTLYVAIADVSHYVQTGSSIDKEAYERGTSVYFPNFVVPMLPEILSNGLCSLNPHLPRLSVVAEIRMDFTGDVQSTDFYEAVIESKARVTYGEAQEIIDGNDVSKLKHVKNEILLASDLAKILMAKRFRDGSLDLEIPETQIVLNSAGIPTDFIRSERLFAHRLIEEMMLAANVATAKFLSSRDIPAMYRIHEPPNADAIVMLEKYLHNFGSKVNIGQGKLQKRLTKSLQEFEGKPEAQILNILTLRSMSQAKYSSDNLGHFGLGFEYYSHFTSPIRRYPDLIVHRLLKSQILKQSNYKLIPEEDLQTAATMLSAAEQRSVKAERQFQSIKKARFMSQFIGEEFEGMISSVTKFGVFVLLRQYEVDGLVRSENLTKEKLEFDEDNLVLVGHKTGIQFAIGDPVNVQVAAADPDSGQIDFAIVGQEYTQGRSKTERSAKGGSRRESRDRDRGREKRGKLDRSRSDKSRPERPGKSVTRPQPLTERIASPRREPSRERNQAVQAKKREETFPKSKKAHAMDHMDDKVFQFLTEANSESQNRGEKFDPEAHLQQALKKWKARMGDSEPPGRPRPAARDASARSERTAPRRGFGARSPDDSESKSSVRADSTRKSGGKESKGTEGFFKKFTKNSDESKPSKSGSGKKRRR